MYAYEPMYVNCPGCQKKEGLEKDDTQVPLGTTIRLLPKQTAARIKHDAETKRVQRPKRKRE